MEKSICDFDNKLVIRHETLKKIRHRVEIIRQVFHSPTVYCRALVEVVRRRRFSLQYSSVSVIFIRIKFQFCELVEFSKLHCTRFCIFVTRLRTFSTSASVSSDVKTLYNYYYCYYWAAS